MKKIALILYIFISTKTAIVAQQQVLWTLQKCIDTALKNNISVKQANVQSKRSAVDWQQAKSNFWPTVSFATPLGVQLGRSINPITNSFTLSSLDYQNYNLSGSILITNWGKLTDVLKAQKNSLDAALNNETKTKNDVTLTIIQDYLQVLLSKEQKINAGIQLEQTKKQLEIANIRFVNGKLSGLDLSQLKSQLASDSINLLSRQADYSKNTISLMSDINIPMNISFETEGIDLNANDNLLLSESPYQINKEAEKNLPQIKIDSLKIESSKMNIRAAKKAMAPSLSFNYNLASSFSNYINDQPFKQWWVDYGYQLKGNFYQQLSISLNIPVFNNLRLRTALNQSKLDLQNLELQEQQDEIQLRENIFSIYSDASFAFKKMNESQEMVVEAEKVYNLTIKGFEIGSKDTYTLITNQNNLAKAKEQLLENRYDYFFKTKILMFYKNGNL